MNVTFCRKKNNTNNKLEIQQNIRKGSATAGHWSSCHRVARCRTRWHTVACHGTSCHRMARCRTNPKFLKISRKRHRVQSKATTSHSLIARFRTTATLCHPVYDNVPPRWDDVITLNWRIDGERLAVKYFYEFETLVAHAFLWLLIGLIHSLYCGILRVVD